MKSSEFRQKYKVTQKDRDLVSMAARGRERDNAMLIRANEALREKESDASALKLAIKGAKALPEIEIR